jgi:crossover junction endodeoxyribonuclease RuvC
MATRCYIGVDPGLKGGIAAVDQDGNFVMAIPMPVTEAAKGKEVDVATLVAFLRGVHDDGLPALAAIEVVHAMPKQGVTSVFTFGSMYGEVRGVLKTLGVPIEHVLPTAWKKVVLHGTQKDKDAAVAFVRRRFPAASLRATPRCTTDHDGMADAICIAEWGRRTFLGLREAPEAKPRKKGVRRVQA